MARIQSKQVRCVDCQKQFDVNWLYVHGEVNDPQLVLDVEASRHVNETQHTVFVEIIISARD